MFEKYFNLTAKAFVKFCKNILICQQKLFVKMFNKYFNLTPKAPCENILKKVGRILKKIWEKILEHRTTTDTLHPSIPAQTQLQANVSRFFHCTKISKA